MSRWQLVATKVSRGGGQNRLVEELPPLIAASALTAAVTYPVDFLRAMRMVSAAEATGATALGIGGAARYFTKGLAPELAKGTVSRIVKFGGFPVAHRFLLDFMDVSESAGTRAIAGAAATVPEIALITPLEVAKLALQLDAVGQKRFANSMGKATRALIDVAGPSALYCGHFALQMRQAVWTSVYFASIPMFVGLLSHSNQPPSATVTGFAGLFAGILGALVNNPIDVCRSVAQKQALSKWVFGSSALGTDSYVPYVGSTFAACRRVVTQNGIQGLWAGSAFKAMHLGLGGALMAVLQPKCAAIWSRRGSLRRPSDLVKLRGGADVALTCKDKSHHYRNQRAIGIRGGALFAGYNPFGLAITPLGHEFLAFEGSRDSDVGRLLSSLKSRKRRATIKSEWLELVRFSKTGQSMRIYQNLEKLLDFLLRCGFIA